MTTTISLDKLITLFNGYITSTDKDFVTYAQNAGFLTATPDADTSKPAILEFNDAAISPAGTTSLSKKVKDIDSKKLTDIYNFIYTYRNVIIDSVDVTKEGFLQDLTRALIVGNVKLNFDADSAKELVETFNLGETNPKIKKLKGKTNFVLKKLVMPTLITAALAAVAGVIIGGVAAIAGSSIFWSGNIGLGIASIASVSALAGVVLAPTIILSKNRITREHYRKKYGTKKALNFKMLADSDVTKAEDIATNPELTNLPIKKLISKIEDTESKLIQYAKSGSKNPFKLMAAYFRRKTNRNRIHELMAFKDMLAEKADEDGLEAKVKKSYEAMLGYIGEFIENDEIKNYALSIERDGVIHNLDIYARNQLTTKKDKRDAVTVREQARKITKNISAKQLTISDDVRSTPGMLVKLSTAYTTGKRTKPKVKRHASILSITTDDKVIDYLKTDTNVDEIVRFTSGKITKEDIAKIMKKLQQLQKAGAKPGAERRAMSNVSMTSVANSKLKYEIIGRIVIGEDITSLLSELPDATLVVS